MQWFLFNIDVCHTIFTYCTIKTKISVIFLNLNKSLEQTEIYTKGFDHYSYICRCPGLINQCTFGLANRLAGSFSPATELELNKFSPLPFRYLMWHLSTQVNNGLLASRLLFLIQGGIIVGVLFPVWFTLWSIQVLRVTL